MSTAAGVDGGTGAVTRTDDTGRVTGLTALTARLARARLAGGGGEGLLVGASVLAASVCSAVAYTLFGGTWMFYERSAHPTGLLAQLVAGDQTFAMIISFYVGLAALACALVVPVLAALVASGAQLGARGRERRLAALRLLGLSSGDVTRMALLDAFVQSAVGTIVGYVVYLVTLPAWGRLSFQAMPVEPREMLLPWWLAVVVGVGLVALGLGASAWGLRQVRISPLGVSRRANRPAVRAWRAGAVVVALGLFALLMPASLSGKGALFVVAASVLGLVAGVNVSGPWVLQLLARLLTRAPRPAVMTAARRIIADPGATWRRVAPLGVLAFIGGYLALMPFSYDRESARSAAERTFMEGAQADFVQGATITLALGFGLTAVALLITQASATIERAEQSRALHRLGAPGRFELRVMWLETFVPIALTVLVGAAAGLFAAMPMARMIAQAGLDQGSDPVMVAVVIGAGLGVAALALLAAHPLHRSLLAVDEPHAD